MGFLPGAVVVGLTHTVSPRSRGRFARSWRSAGLSGGPPTELLKILIFSGVIAYVSFFIYVLSPLLGRVYSLSVLGVSVVIFVSRSTVRRHVRIVFGHRDVLTPLLIALSVGFLYTGSTLLYGGEVHVSLVANSRYRDPLPPDNILPRLVAERVLDGIRGEPFLGDWLSSDRPPLQAAAETLVSPLIPKGSRELNYQAIATMAQLLVIPAGWILLRRLRINFGTTLGVIVATALSGTMALHSTYVWPKLLCAAYSLLCIAALIPAEGRGTKRDHLVPWSLLAGAALALSFAAHGGGLFVLLPILCVLILSFGRRFLPSTVAGRSGISEHSQSMQPIVSKPNELVLAVGGALLVGALLLAPWLVYQSVVAPPGNRLLKWHLAGVTDVDQRSFVQSMIDQYTKQPIRAIIANKTSNIRELVNPSRFLADVMPVMGSDDSIDLVRQREFGHLGNSVSISMVGVGLGAAGWLVNRRRSRELVAGLFGLAAGGLGTLLWCVALYGPKATLPHQGSLAVPLVLIGSSALLAASAHRWALVVFVALSAYKVTRVWILAGPLSPDRHRSTAALSMLLVGGVALLVIVVNALRVTHTEQTPTSSELVLAEKELLLA